MDNGKQIPDLSFEETMKRIVRVSKEEIKETEINLKDEKKDSNNLDKNVGKDPTPRT